MLELIESAGAGLAGSVTLRPEASPSPRRRQPAAIMSFQARPSPADGRSAHRFPRPAAGFQARRAWSAWDSAQDTDGLLRCRPPRGPCSLGGRATRGPAPPPAPAAARAPRSARAPPPEGPPARAGATRAGPLGPPPSTRSSRPRASPPRMPRPRSALTQPKSPRPPLGGLHLGDLHRDRGQEAPPGCPSTARRAHSTLRSLATWSALVRGRPSELAAAARELGPEQPGCKSSSDSAQGARPEGSCRLERLLCRAHGRQQ
jgi:hypothetical protein